MKNAVANLVAEQGDAPGPSRPAAPAASSSTAPAVLLALFEDGHPTASLLRARALGRALGAELQVMRVLPERRFVSSLLPQDHAMTMMRTVERTLKVNRSTREWLGCCLGNDDAALPQLAIAYGNFVDEVALHAAKLGAVLIVVPRQVGRMGGTVTSLASTAGVPVLLTRESTHDETVIEAGASLAEACKHNADLVVVGTRRCGWLHRLLAGNVAAKVVNRAKRSVLVTPLDDLGKLADATAAHAGPTLAPWVRGYLAWWPAPRP